MSKILTEDFDVLISEYDNTHKEINKIKKIVEGYITNLIKGIGKLHKDAARDSRVQNFTKQIQGALKKNDDMISKAMPIVQRALKAREKALNDIETKILSKADPELGKALKAAMDESKAKVSQFTQALNTFMKAIGPEATPAAPTAQTTPAAPAAPAAATTSATPPAAPVATAAPEAKKDAPAAPAAQYNPNYSGDYDPSKGSVAKTDAKPDTKNKKVAKKDAPKEKPKSKPSKKTNNQQDEPFDSSNQGWVGEGTKK
jgi:hypothetical protein